MVFLPTRALRQAARPTRLHQDVAVAMLDQTILSVFNFLLQLALIRFWQPDQYGEFALFANAFLTLSNFQNGLFTTQYGVLVPQAGSDAERADLRTAIFTWNVLYCVVFSLVASAAIQLVVPDHSVLATFAAGTCYFGATLLREYTRVAMISEQRVATALWTDLAGLAVALGFIGVFFRFFSPPDVWHVLFSLAMGAATSIAIESLGNRNLYPLSLSRETCRRYVDIFRQHVSWILVGIITTELQLRTLFFLLGAWYGLATVGVVQAGMMLFRPIGVLWLAWSRVIRPVFAKAYASGDGASAARLSHLSAAGFLAATVASLAAIWIFWPLIEQYVFAHRYPGVGQAVAFWGLVMTVSFVKGTYSVQLQGQTRFRELSYISLIAAALTIGSMIVIARLQGPIHAILGSLAGELFMLIAVLWIMDRRPRPAVTASQQGKRR